MNWPRTNLDGLMMAGWFCFAAGAGILFRPMMPILSAAMAGIGLLLR